MCILAIKYAPYLERWIQPILAASVVGKNVVDYSRREFLISMIYFVYIKMDFQVSNSPLKIKFSNLYGDISREFEFIMLFWLFIVANKFQKYDVC